MSSRPVGYHVIAIALAVLGRIARYEAVAGLVVEQPTEKIGAAGVRSSPVRISICGQLSLNRIPPVSANQCCMLPVMPKALVVDLADIERIGQNPVDMPPRERRLPVARPRLTAYGLVFSPSRASSLWT